MRLFIAEKPELARAIVEGLGGGRKQGHYYECGDDYVTWCIGHMIELYMPEDYDRKYASWSLDHLPIHEQPYQYKVKENTREQFEGIIELMNDADEIVHAGDNDTEGQLIVDEILDYYGYEGPVKRFLTNDYNIDIIQKALANMKDNADYQDLYQSAFARNLGDQLYGLNMTRLYTIAARDKGYDGVLSIGRVQTPILGLVVNRDRVHSEHKKQTYYELFAEFEVNQQRFSAKYLPKESDPVDDKNRLVDLAFVNSITEIIANQQGQIAESKTEIKYASAPLPYNILKLQADASRMFDYKPDKVMDITQTLREKHKLITYNGTDCQYLNEEQHNDAADIFEAIVQTMPDLKAKVDVCDAAIKSRAFNNKNVSAHHAIIPTKASADLTVLSQAEKDIYKIVVRNYIAQFYPKHEYRDTQIIVTCKGHTFTVRSKVSLDLGWKKLFTDSAEDDSEIKDDAIDIDLSGLSSGESGPCITAEVLSKETKPQALYTMSSLLMDLTRVAKYITNPKLKQLLIDKDKDKKDEHGGIGTSRTRDKIISKLFDIGFLQEKGKKIISTDLGRKFFDLLPSEITQPDMTALWHEQQSMIEKGEYSVDNFIKHLMHFIDKHVAQVKAVGLDIDVDTHECPQCKEGHLRSRKGKNGKFWACSRYPDCSFTVPNKGGKPDFKSLETHPCPTCDKPMKRRKGKSGYFWGCTGYPDCKTTLEDKRGKPVANTVAKASDEYDCKTCGKPLTKRKSKSGKGHWWGCTGYPDCKTTYQDKDSKPLYE